MTDSEVNISTFAGRGIPAKKKKFLCSYIQIRVIRAQKYWSGTVTCNTVMQRAADYLHLHCSQIAWGPKNRQSNGDLISSEMGTQWGPSTAEIEKMR